MGGRPICCRIAFRWAGTWTGGVEAEAALGLALIEVKGTAVNLSNSIV